MPRNHKHFIRQCIVNLRIQPLNKILTKWSEEQFSQVIITIRSKLILIIINKFNISPKSTGNRYILWIILHIISHFNFIYFEKIIYCHLNKIIKRYKVYINPIDRTHICKCIIEHLSNSLVLRISIKACPLLCC